MGRREYKLYFLSIFPPKTKYHEKKLKYFLSSYFSIFPLFHSSNQTDPKSEHKEELICKLVKFGLN